MHERMIEVSRDVSTVARQSLTEIQGVTRATKMLATNALIEAAHAGEHGKGFAIVAEEVGRISTNIDTITEHLRERLDEKFSEMDRLSRSLVVDTKGERLADLALMMIDIIDRNLFERSCDVRWWATDSAVVDALTNTDPQAAAFASQRLGVILDSYTVYFDLWIADADGKVVANGRPDRFPHVAGSSVASAEWFKKSMSTRSGADYVACDVERNMSLDAAVGTYATAIREGGRENGKALGALGIFFDWQNQSADVVGKVRLPEAERETTRCMLLDKDHRVIASSDGHGILSETFPLETDGKPSGYYQAKNGDLVAFAKTPGYETYEGLGWYGVIAQRQQAAEQRKAA
ncbi:MAG: methyl-accepting chemotaxis protein [Planctomycetota bacterium]